MHACVYTDYYDFDSLCKNKHLLQSHNACVLKEIIIIYYDFVYN